MNLKTIKQIAFVEKKVLVSEACLMYNKLRQVTAAEKKQTGRVSDVITEGHLINAKTYSVMESVLDLLDGEYAMIIQNDFIDKAERFWFLTNWSKSTYYRLKHEAVDQFLFLLYA